MRTISLILISAASLTLLLIEPTNGIDIEGAKESACFEIRKTVDLDIGWVTSHSVYYYPLMSRYDLYMASMDLSGRSAKDLTEDEVYYDSCITFGVTEGSFWGKGFDGKRKSYTMKPIKGMEIYEFLGEDGYQATCYTTLTDNKSFAVAACCTGDQMTWGVSSSEKSLPQATINEIYDHAESLGFKREQFTGQRYDHCEKRMQNKNEL